MNFYQHQDRARRQTTLLVVYFALAVLCIALALNAVVFLATKAARSEPLILQTWLTQPYWLWISAAVGALIVLGTLHTSLRLRGGGQALAEMVGARRIDPATQGADERRLLNVVEEMAIASGSPVPALYVLDSENGINAFVAGTRPSETVLVVTRGALDSFDRDELQGVVAHEYSHIFNGDMRLNLRLMGVLAGILVIGQIGRLMLRAGVHGRNRRGGQWALIGLGVLVIGYIGLFFGALIKAAVSRQREFLADASAVQFTRLPNGIAGALYKIKQHAGGSLLDNAHAEDLSHFCFGESVRHAFSGLLATHPPLDARIAAIEPGFAPRHDTATTGAAAAAGAAEGAIGFAGSASAVSPPQVADTVGTVAAGHVDYARRLQAEWPPAIVAMAHATDDAPRLVYALLLAASADHARAALVAEVERLDARHASDLETAATTLLGLPRQARLALLNLALPALKQAGSASRQRLLDTVRALIAADGRFTVFEFALQHLLRDHLRDAAAEAVPVEYFRFADVATEVRLLLSVLAQAGNPAPAAASAAFGQAWRPFALGEAEPVTPTACTLDALDAALDRLARLSPLLQKNLISACADCVQHDGRVTAAEHDLLQVFALTLDCPLPPLV